MPFGRFFGQLSKGALNRGSVNTAAMWAGARDVMTGMGGGAYTAGARGMVYGGAAGGLYGAMSDDTSVIGGALMGAAAGRYGASGLRRGLLGRRGIGGVASPGLGGFSQGFYRGVRNRARADAGGVRMMANRALNAMPTPGLKGWTRGFSPAV